MANAGLPDRQSAVFRAILQNLSSDSAGQM